MTKDEIESLPQTLKGLCELARKLGYKDKNHQLQLDRDNCIGDMIEFFDDNPGAIGAILEWASDWYGTDEDEASLNDHTDYISLEKCKESGAHLESCDDDGYCNGCGEQGNEEPE